MVVVISYGPLVGCCYFLPLLDGCLDRGSYFVEAVGHNGHVRGESAKKGTWNNGLGPSNAVACFGTRLIVPHCAIPKFAGS